MDLPQIGQFFAPPIPDQPGPTFGTPYLARREAQECLVGEPHSETTVLRLPGPRPRLFATTMVVMAAIDLMATCSDGRDATAALTTAPRRS